MSTTLHFQDLRNQKNLICLVNTRMGVLFRITTSVRFNYFIPHCFVLCATIHSSEYHRIIYLNRLLINGTVISKPLLNKHVIISTRLSDLLLPFDLFYFIVRRQKSSFPHHLISSFSCKLYYILL